MQCCLKIAIIASAAVPGLMAPTKLRKKRPDGFVFVEEDDEAYYDGSIDQDIPKNGLGEMFNCHFFLAAQTNPHILPFRFNAKGDVALPSQWSSKLGGDLSWRGGFILAGLEIYLKSDMKNKLQFLKQMEVLTGFISTLYTQEQYGGTSTIIPSVSVADLPGVSSKVKTIHVPFIIKYIAHMIVVLNLTKPHT